MTPDKEHAPALMQQAADEAVAYVSNTGAFITPSEFHDRSREAQARFRPLYAAPTYEQGVTAGLEMAAKVAEKALEPLAKLSSDVEWDDVPDNARADVVYRSEAGGEESIGTIAFADFRRARAAIRALADQHKPSPAEEPMP